MQAENISVLHSTNPVEVQSGVIESVNEQCCRIDADNRHYHATRAFSCMVEPIVNDTVLFSIDTHGLCHILAIIERPDCTDTRLAFPGDVTVAAGKGQLLLNARQGISISSPRSINQTSEKYTLTANKAIFGIESMTAVGAKLVSKFSNVQTIADTVETVATNLLQKLKNSFREIEGLDQSRSRDVINTVKNLYSMRSTQAAILARKDIKVDAERIHMG